jgi:hypothetical protein
MRSLLGRMTVYSLVVTVAAGLMVSVASAGAPKRKNKLVITGPTANLFQTFFSETVSGYATGPANYVISGEQLNPAGGCASTFVAELHKPDFGLWGRSRNRPGGTRPVHGSFSTVARFWARNHSEHGICSYLINSKTRRTYAYASRWWNNS